MNNNLRIDYIKMKVTDLILVSFALITVVSCAHYRGSMVTWRVVNSTTNPLVIGVFQRHAWNFMIGSENLVCVSPCLPNVTTLSSVAVRCTGFNPN